MINLIQVETLIQSEILPMIADLDGISVEDLAEVKDKASERAFKAEVSKDLLMLADQLAYAEQLVRKTYWAYKGRNW